MKNAHAQITFRTARVKDRPALLRLIRALYRFDEIPFRSRTVDSGLRKLLHSPALGQAWMIEDGTRPVGYMLLTFNYDLEYDGLEGILTDLFIRPGYRSRGIGSRALAVVYDYCRSAGIRALELQVHERNRRTQAFYRKEGFTRLTRQVMLRDID